MRSATVRAAIRRGWVCPISPRTPRPSSRQIFGSWVVLPEPVSPATMTTWWSRMAAAMSSRRWLTGSSSGVRHRRHGGAAGRDPLASAAAIVRFQGGQGGRPPGRIALPAGRVQPPPQPVLVAQRQLAETRPHLGHPRRVEPGVPMTVTKRRQTPGGSPPPHLVYAGVPCKRLVLNRGPLHTDRQTGGGSGRRDQVASNGRPT